MVEPLPARAPSTIELDTKSAKSVGSQSARRISDTPLGNGKGFGRPGPFSLVCDSCLIPVLMFVIKVSVNLPAVSNLGWKTAAKQRDKRL